MDDKSILLESGTNELNIMELEVGNQKFGINALKIREVIPFDRNFLTAMPDSHTSLIGMYLYRDMTVPVIDLAKELKREYVEDNARQVLLITEFNGIVNGFLIDKAERIYRLSWTAIKQPPEVIEKYKARITGVTSLNEDEVLILDLENIITGIFPDTAMRFDDITEPEKTEFKRENARIMIAEDSNMIRESMVKILKKAGYIHIESFVNGQDAYNRIVWYIENSDNLQDNLDLLITDIEMPQMDGLTLCRHLKQKLGYEDLPVVIFSSMINEQMALKCQQVGADDYITKPQIKELVDLIDGLLMKKQ